MPNVADRVKETTTTTGTGNVTLAGAASGFIDFNTAFGLNVTFYYCIANGTEWEVGVGHLSGTTALVRDTVLASSNAGALVNFSAGTKNVFCTIPSQFVKGANLGRSSAQESGMNRMGSIPGF